MPPLMVTKHLLSEQGWHHDPGMFLTYKKGLKLDGTNPVCCMRMADSISLVKPSFSTSRIALLEQGFKVSAANLRGGSEYGEEWHKGAGMLENQNKV